MGYFGNYVIVLGSNGHCQLEEHIIYEELEVESDEDDKKDLGNESGGDGDHLEHEGKNNVIVNNMPPAKEHATNKNNLGSKENEIRSSLRYTYMHGVNFTMHPDKYSTSQMYYLYVCNYSIHTSGSTYITGIKKIQLECA